MGVVSTQGLSFRLVANDVALDLFKDEEIKVSDNITGLFDIGDLPSDFTRTITLPGTKKNNAFFEHVYDISIENPFLFSTNRKVNAYFDFGGIYVASGYLQLNKVNVIANKFIDSYEVTVYGSLSSFAREINRANITDLTTLTQYNHSSSLTAITSSWAGDLFGGNIVYPLADYGQNIEYVFAANSFGINQISGALSVKDFKPAIRVQKVWDAIFEEYGYSYESEFIGSGVWDDIYLLCDNNLKYPIYDGVDLEGFGKFQASPLTGSDTDLTMTNGIYLALSYDNVTSNPQFSYINGVYGMDRTRTMLKGRIKLEINVSGSAGVPQFTLRMDNGTQQYDTSLVKTNEYFRELDSQVSSTGNKKYTLEERFTYYDVVSGSYEFKLKYDNYNGSTFTVINNPNGSTNAYIAIDEVSAAADYRVMKIAQNLPYGESGIKQIDFIKGLQKKFNLIIYPSKTKPNHFIVETFNNWYKQGQVKSFNDFIDLNKKIEVIPANNLAVREVNFGDLLGKDYLAQQFEKETNRDFGVINYIDNQNFFSQGKLDVKTTFSASPLRYLPGTGLSGSAAPTAGVAEEVQLGNYLSGYGSVCALGTTTVYSVSGTGVNEYIYTDLYLTNPVTGYDYMADATGDVYDLNSATGQIGFVVGTCGSLTF